MATAASPMPTSLTMEPNESDCSICHEAFSEPKLLRCGHLLCRQCLLSWLQSQSPARCPLCRYIITDKDTDESAGGLEVIVDSFPTDLSMVAVIDADRLFNQQHMCRVCEDVAAISMCLDCGDLFCPTCTKVHKKQTATRGHNVEDLQSVTVDKLVSHRPSPCPAHADKACELFCPSHEASMCTVCFVSQHRSCADVVDLQQKADECRTELATLAKQLKETERALDQAINKLGIHLLVTEKKIQGAVEELETACQRVEAVIQACRQRMKQLASGISTDINQAVQLDRTDLLQKKSMAASHGHVVQRVQGMKKGEVVMTMTSVLKPRVTDMYLRAQLACLASVGTMTFTLNQALRSRLQHDIASLGEFTLTQDSTPDPVKQAAVAELRFHDNHGEKIVLSNNTQTAKRRGHRDNNGVVIGCDPMVPNTLYEVCVDKAYGTKESVVDVGVVMTSPEDLKIPEELRCLTSSAVIITTSDVRVISSDGETTIIRTHIGDGLRCLKVNSRIGVLVDEDCDLHFYLDGKDQGVAAPDMPDTCYPVFEAYGKVKQITAMPVQTIDDSGPDSALGSPLDFISLKYLSF